MTTDEARALSAVEKLALVEEAEALWGTAAAQSLADEIGAVWPTQSETRH